MTVPGRLHPLTCPITIEAEMVFTSDAVIAEMKRREAAYTAWMEQQLAELTAAVIDEYTQIMAKLVSAAVCGMFMAENSADAYRPEGLTPCDRR